MALIVCPDCKKEISDKAKSCPHCGFTFGEENNAPPENKGGTILAIVFLLIVAAPVLFFLFTFARSVDKAWQSVAVNIFSII